MHVKVGASKNEVETRKKRYGKQKSRPFCFPCKERSAFRDSLNCHPLPSVARESNDTYFITKLKENYLFSSKRYFSSLYLGC